jgi:hypothetical protein
MTTTTIHELFPLDGDEDPEHAARVGEIDRIYVRRRENGKFDYSPMTFEPDALPNMETLFQLFGGGEYILEARDTGRTFCRSRRLTLPGSPKPLAGPAFAAEEKPAPAPPPPAPQTSDAALFMTMFQSMMQFQMNAQQEQTKLLVALMTRGDASSSATLERQRELEREARENQATFFQSMLAAAQARAAEVGGGGGAGTESFLKGVEFMQGMMETMMQNQGGGAGGDGGADFLSSLKEFMAGLGVIANQAKANGVTSTDGALS